MSKVSLVFAGLAAALTALAPRVTRADDETDEAVIRGSRTRPGETWIGHAEIERTGAVTVSDALRPQSDVDIQGGGAAGSVGRFTLRGAAPEESLVVVDGLRMSSRAAGAVVGGTDPNNLPVALIQRMAIARGPLSAVYGPNAVAGVLQITTREAQGPWALSGSLQGGTALTDVTVEDSDPLGVAPFFAGRGQLSAAVREGPRFVVAALTAGGTRGWVPNTQAYLLGGALKVGRVVPGGVAYAWVDAFDSRTGSPAFDSLFDADAFDADDLQLRRGVRAAGVLRRAVGARGTLELSAGLLTQRTTLLNPTGADLTAGVEAAESAQHISELQLHAQYTHDTRGALGAVTFGLDAGREGFSAGDDESTVAYRVAPSARLRRSLGSATLDLAARLDVDSLYGAQVSPRGAVELALGRSVQVFAAVGRGFRPPTFSELAWPTLAYPMAMSGPQGERGNPDLRVESAWGGDVAVVAQPPGGRWEASARVFGLRTTDMIRWALGDDGYWAPRNVDVAWAAGGVLEGRVRLGAHLVAQASGFYQRTVDADGEEVTGRLRAKVTGRLTWFERDGWRAWAEALWFDRAGVDATGAPWRGVFVNARVGRQIGRAAGVFVLGENLLDQRFESARRLPTPGRTLWVGLTLDLDED